MRASLAGIPLPVDPSVAWGLTWGTSPYELVLEAPTALAARLVSVAKAGAPLDLVSEAGSVRVEGVRAIGVRAGPRPDVDAVLLVDARWTWRYGRYRRIANVRTRINERRRIVPGAPLAVKQLLDSETYRQWSMKGGRQPWKVRDLLADVAAAVGGVVRLGDRVDEATLGSLEEEPENVTIDARLDVAVAQVLGYCGGGISVYVGVDGVPVFAPVRDQSERVLFGAQDTSRGTRTRGQRPQGIGPQIAGTPSWKLLDRRLERPSSYRVLFDRRVEVRLDYAGDEDAGDWAPSALSTSGGESPPPLDLTNVLPVPEESLTVAGRTVLQGVYVPVVSYLEAKAGTWAPPTVGDVTLPLVRAAWLGGGLEEFAQPLYDDAGVAARALGAVRGNFRGNGGTFQVRRALRERVAEFEASVGSIVDPQTGSRPDSPVWADYSSWLGWRSAAQERERSPLGTALVRNYFADGSKDGGPISGLPITSLRRAPARVQVVDQDLGILRVMFAVDATGEVITTIGSALKGTLPSTDPTQKDMLLQWGVLADEHRLAVLLTASLAAPAGEEGLYAVDVSAEAALRRAGAEPQACEGPVCTLRIDANTMTADFGWDDTQRETIRNVLAGLAPDSALNGLLLNPNNVEQVAAAAAAAHMGVLVDRVDGGLTTGLRPATPAGGAAIEFRVGRGGATTTAASAPGLEAPPLEALLPESVRRLVLRRLP